MMTRPKANVGHIDDEQKGPVSIRLELESVLREEEASLTEMEHMLTARLAKSLDSEPRELLDVVQHIEVLLGRLGQLEAQRVRLLERKRRVGGLEGPAPANGMADNLPESDVAGTLATHRRVATIGARVRKRNATNHLLLASLTRLAGARANWLTRLQEHRASYLPSTAGENESGRGGSGLNVQA